MMQFVTGLKSRLLGMVDTLYYVYSTFGNRTKYFEDGWGNVDASYRLKQRFICAS